MVTPVQGTLIPTFEGNGKLLLIDPNKCVLCSICEQLCPNNAINVSGAGGGLDGYPPLLNYSFAFYPNQCDMSGYCQAECPTGAIQISNLPPAGTGSGNNGGNNPPVTPVSTNNIKSYLTNGCAVAALNKFLNNQIQARIGQIITQLINMQNVNLTIDQAPLADPNIDAYTHVGQSTNEAGQIVYDIYITLNENMFPQNTQEYLVSTIMHEFMHGYLGATDQNGYFDHNELGNFYQEMMADALQEIFPALSAEDASALSWGGLESSYAWSELLRQYPQYADTLQQIDKAYKLGTKGTSCQ